MKVTNKTAVELKVMGTTLKPEETRTYVERCHYSLEVNSEIGKCTIKTFNKERSFETEGQLEVREGEKDEYGLTSIFIYQKS